VSRALEDARFAALEKGVALDAHLEPVGTVVADEHRIEQIVLNVTSNAVKFTPAGGRISVTLSQRDSFARLVVADNGAGIAPEFLPHVFEPFAQGNAESTQGLGLGLAIVKHLVEAHEGGVWVTSDGPQRGTTFMVELPIAKVAAVDAARNDSTSVVVVNSSQDSVLH
jgi:signal transduction histidine kinase